MNHISAIVGYWDCDQRCVFSNDAYLEWFGKTPEQMVGITMKELLGPLYEQNRPFILGALKGEKQVFERRIPLPEGGYKDTIATYTPDIIDGTVLGFSVLVADVTPLREREAALDRVLKEKEEILAQVRELTGLLPVCAWCRKIKNDEGYWFQFEEYVKGHTKAEFTHGICPDCRTKLKK
ncbi:MAG: PAS domain-containing protein [Acidobacteria bacterium]|nr:PAS domain-containing protein [Acidobacteriota bacterium]